MLVKKGKDYDKAVSNAYNMLVVFRRIIESNPQLKTYEPQEVEEVYKQLWCEALGDRKAPWL